MIRRLFYLIGFVLVLVMAMGGGGETAVAAPEANDLRISQVYGGGGNSGATYTHDFIEIFNSGSSSVSLAGWSVQYASATGTSWQVTNLSGSIAPGGYYLIQQAAGSGGTTPLPTPNATGNIAMSATAGKVALVNTTTALSGACPTAGVIDFVGFGTTPNCYEGAGSTPAPSNTLAVLRGNNGCTDTDNNNTDFATGSPAPRNSSSPPYSCVVVDIPPTVSSTSPADGATDVSPASAITINFSEPVSATADAFALECPTGTPVAFSSSPALPGDGSSFVLTPAAALPLNTTCTVTVTAAEITDLDGDPNNMEADYSFSFTTAAVDVCSLSYTPIYEIQGSGLSAAITGVVTTQGVVVGDFEGASPALRGFYLQDLTGDGEVLTSDGIFVFNGNNNSVNLGDVVRVTGTAGEFEEQTQISSVTSIVPCGAGSVAPVDISLPFASAEYLERYEGMLVRLPQTLYVTENFRLGRFGQVTLTSRPDRLQQPTNVALPGAPALALQEANNLDRIIVDDILNSQNPDPIVFGRGGLPLSAANTLRGGDSASEIVGVLTYTWGGNAVSPNAYRVRPIGALNGGIIDFQPANPRQTGPQDVGGTVQVASFNVLNYFNTFTGCTAGVGGAATDCRGANNATEFTRQRDKIINAIVAIDADVVGLMEIENDGYGVNSAIADLVNGLNAAAGAGTYAYVNADALTGATNILGTDAIKVGLLYQPGRVSLAGTTAVLNSNTAPAGTTFLDSKNRPVLIQSFQHIITGEIFTVAVNHLKSKGSACTDVGDPDAGDGQGNCNITRRNAAQALAVYLANNPTGVGSGYNLIIGDLNAYAMEDPITVIKNADYTDLVRFFGGLDAYGYQFDGQWGYLDHALASNALFPFVTGAAEWHINADEPIILDYNMEFKSAGQIVSLYDNSPFRSSDHDPVIVGLNLSPTYELVINEVYTEEDGGFIELKNVAATAVDLGDYTIDLLDGLGSVYDQFDLPEETLAAGGYYVICAFWGEVTNCDLEILDALETENGAIGLRQNGALVDAVSYGVAVPGYTETNHAPADPAVEGKGLSRYPNGVDTNDNSADFSVRCITPGIANSSANDPCVVDFDQRCEVGPGTYEFGVTAPITITLNDLGEPPIFCIKTMYFEYDHPNASSAIQTGAYWHIEVSDMDGEPAGIIEPYNFNLTLPVSNPQNPEDKLCRWLEGAGIGAGWDCAADVYGANSITRTGLNAFSDWAIGRDVTPTAVSLHTLTAQSTNPAGLLLLTTGLMALGLTGLALRRRNG